jgi:hypothetical protein
MTNDKQKAFATQFHELKARDPSVILLFRVNDNYGDMYRVYREDVTAVEVILRGSGIRPAYSYCGQFPNHWDGYKLSDLETVLSRIVAAGKRAAICEQVKRPVPQAGDPCQNCGAPVAAHLMDGDECPACGFVFPYEEDLPAGAKVERVATAHDLYATGDKDAPDCVKDCNGEVVLAMCRRCRKGEAELDEPCEKVEGRTKHHITLTYTIDDDGIWLEVPRS